MTESRPRVVVGVDAGGTSTRAVAVDETGLLLGSGRAAAGNPTSSGPEDAAANVVAAVRAALGATGERPVRIAVAMAGASTARTDWLTEAVAAAEIAGEVAIEADLAAIYLSGSRAPLGYAVLSGTGAIAARLVDHRIEVVADGLGWLVGDDGSGFWIGRRVLRAAAADLDGRGPATALTAALVAELPDTGGDLVRSAPLSALVRAAYAERPVRLARFAPLAFAAADHGDPVASEIVAEAAALLASTLGSVLADDHDAPVVLGGSVLAGQPRMADTVRAELLRRGLRGPISIVPDGVLGAAVLALEGAGLSPDEPTVARIRTALRPGAGVR